MVGSCRKVRERKGRARVEGNQGKVKVVRGAVGREGRSERMRGGGKEGGKLEGKKMRRKGCEPHTRMRTHAQEDKHPRHNAGIHKAST